MEVLNKVIYDTILDSLRVDIKFITYLIYGQEIENDRRAMCTAEPEVVIRNSEQITKEQTDK